MNSYQVTVHHTEWGEARKHSVTAISARFAVMEAAQIEYDEWGFEDPEALEDLRFEWGGTFYTVEVDWSPDFHVTESAT